jgi:DNA-directed RNA polymerase specialized sigma24 family protein
VNQVESATLRRLLIKRYIQNLTWEKIAEQLNYSYKHVVHILHPKALSAIKRVLEKD